MKTKYFKIIFSLLLLLFPGLFSGGILTAKNYRLHDLVELLKQNSLLLEIATIDNKIAKEDYRAARALPNPEIEMFKGEAEVPGEPGRPAIWGVGGKISIPNPLYRFYFLKSLRKHISEAEIEAEIKKNNIIKDLKTHYFHLQFARKIAVLLQKKIARLTEVNRITKAKATIGEAKEIDYLRTSVEIQKNKSRLFRMEKIVSHQRIKINEFLNFSLEGDYSMAADFSYMPLAGIEESLDELIERCPLIVLKANELEKKKAGLKASRFSILEAVELFGERGQEVDAKTWKVGIGISLPIFNTHAAQIRKAKYERRKAQKEFEHAGKHLFADIDRMVSEIRVLEKEIDTFTGAVLKEGRKNIELTEKLYKEGEISLVVFLDSQNSFFEIEQRYYEAITEWKILKAELDELLGEEI
ncbi:MAG: TolC family protein [Candidatus Aminicenantes bacterium]|nr:TolC family protein [Candidatus Aminicenantes bacterium]